MDEDQFHALLRVLYRRRVLMAEHIGSILGKPTGEVEVWLRWDPDRDGRPSAYDPPGGGKERHHDEAEER